MTMLTQSLVREFITYHPITGEAVWNHRDAKYFVNNRMSKVWNTRYCGKPVGAGRPDGYLVTSLFNKTYRLHKLIWLYQTGHYPNRLEFIDHIDHDPENNTWINLRLITPSESQKNHSKQKRNNSDYTGVLIRKGPKGSTYRVQVSSTYKTLEEAIAIRDQVRAVLGGFHPNHGH
jgi:hypothetical protein